MAPDEATWSILSTPGYCWYKDDEETYKNPYGAFYNWYAVNTDKLCPVGWKVPTNNDWVTLINYLINNGYGYEESGDDIAKSLASASGWTTHPTSGAVGNDQSNNNSSGFTGYPAGHRNVIGLGDIPIYDNIGDNSNWWSSTEYDSSKSQYYFIHYDSPFVRSRSDNKKFGFSVRCVNENTISGSKHINSEAIGIFPNPTAEILYINYGNYSNIFIEIIDLQGKQIINQHLDANNINISNFKNGIYILKIIESGNVITKKFIIMK